jgi:hypothetical protein
MAHIYRAQLTPSKLELVEGWAPSQPWFAGDADGTFEQLANYRFDDPLGKVGLEVLFVRMGEGPVMQIPLTYRDAPFDPAESWLIGTLMHSVLGKRWVYDATGDPAFVAALASAILTGGVQAELMVETENGMQRREPTARVRGTGDTGGGFVAEDVGEITTRETANATVITGSDLQVVVLRRPLDALAFGTQEESTAEAQDAALVGTWTGQSGEVTLALLLS